MPILPGSYPNALFLYHDALTVSGGGLLIDARITAAGGWQYEGRFSGIPGRPPGARFFRGASGNLSANERRTKSVKNRATKNDANPAWNQWFTSKPEKAQPSPPPTFAIPGDSATLGPCPSRLPVGRKGSGRRRRLQRPKAQCPPIQRFCKFSLRADFLHV